MGGKEAVRGQFPWQAQIHARSGEKFRLACGGTLVSDHIVVTAGGRIIAITNLNSNDLFTWIFKKKLGPRNTGERLARKGDSNFEAYYFC